MALGWAANNEAGPPDGPAGGDLGGTYPDPLVDGLQGDPVSAVAPALADALVFDGVEWTPTALTADNVGASGPLGSTTVQQAINHVVPDFYYTAGVGPTVSGSGFVTYFTVTTPALAAGTYRVFYCAVFQCTAATGAAGVQVLVNGVATPTATTTPGAAPSNSSRMEAAGMGTRVHAGGTITLLVQVNRFAGTGNVISQSGYIELRRVA